MAVIGKRQVPGGNGWCFSGHRSIDTGMDMGSLWPGDKFRIRTDETDVTNFHDAVHHNEA